MTQSAIMQYMLHIKFSPTPPPPPQPQPQLVTKCFWHTSFKFMVNFSTPGNNNRVSWWIKKDTCPESHKWLPHPRSSLSLTTSYSFLFITSQPHFTIKLSDTKKRPLVVKNQPPPDCLAKRIGIRLFIQILSPIRLRLPWLAQFVFSHRTLLPSGLVPQIPNPSISSSLALYDSWSSLMQLTKQIILSLGLWLFNSLLFIIFVP